jgi:SAM-dependent methyltransferase
MVGRRAYDWAYRWWAPWDSVGVRDDLRRLLDEGTANPAEHPRAVDLGCGTGANVVFMAERGFQATGVDFSAVALEKARARAAEAGVGDRCRFVQADLTLPTIPGLEDTFDLAVDYGTLDDLRGAGREALAGHMVRLVRPGGLLLLWCFYGSPDELPAFSFRGASRMSSLAPGEVDKLFGEAFEISEFASGYRTACFLMRRLPGTISHS